MALPSSIKSAERRESLFISLEHETIVPARVRAALPQLQNELRKKWPVEDVEIENRMARRTNPFNPHEILAPHGIGLVVLFGRSVAISAGFKVGGTVGSQITAHVLRWIRSFGKTKSRKPDAKVGKKSR
jgi:hypothetical protein